MTALAMWSAQAALGQPAPELPPPQTSPFAATEAAPPTIPPLKEAASVEEALDYTEAEKEILSAVRDGGDWDTTAFYVLLRRAAMLPEGMQTFEQAERPNPRDLWHQPQRYRGRLIRFEGKIPRPITDWTDRLTITRWWGGRGVYLVDVMEGATGQPMLVAMIAEPHQGIFLNQRLRFAGIFYKTVTLPENSKSGAPSVTHEYPLIIAKQFYRSELLTASEGPAQIAAAITVLIVLVAVFLVFFRHRRRPLPRQVVSQTLRERRQARHAVQPEPAGPEDVDEELRRQVESYNAQQRTSPGDQDGDKPKDSR